MSLPRLARELARRSPVLVFTGAGISTPSGIPDFRGPEGLWRRWRPVYYQEFLSSEEARRRHWEYKLEGWTSFRDARPNAAHRALVELERLGRLDWLITQNIDGLHQLAGHDPARVIELHGTNRLVECVQCKEHVEPDPVYEEFARTRIPPRCRCGGFLKPATVSFGQQMPQALLEAAFQASRQARLVLSVGSSLEVEPAASIPRLAKEGGAFYAIVNRGPTAHDSLADLRLEGDVARLLPELVRLLRREIRTTSRLLPRQS